LRWNIFAIDDFYFDCIDDRDTSDSGGGGELELLGGSFEVGTNERLISLENIGEDVALGRVRSQNELDIWI
jgi:hypothetical protein